MMNYAEKEIKDYDGKYLISNHGDVISTNYNKTGKRKTMSHKIDKDGYKKIGLSKNGKVKYYMVHRLVYEAFIGEIPDGKVIDHIDGNPSNPMVSNLRLCSNKENHNFPIALKRHSKASSKPIILKRLSDNTILNFNSRREANKKLGYKNAISNAICKNKKIGSNTFTVGGIEYELVDNAFRN